MRRAIPIAWLLIGASCVPGCGNGGRIWVTGVLLKGGARYVPPEGHKLAVHFLPVGDEKPGGPSAEVELAIFDERDGSFTLPGREGLGIAPGKYRIALVETLRREAFDALKKEKSDQRGRPRFGKDLNFLEAGFGERNSPIVRDLTSSTRLTIDLSKPEG